MITTKQKIGDYIDGGSECSVFKYGNDKVLKVYRYREHAKHAIEHGRMAFENGIGPEVFSDEPFEYWYDLYEDGEEKGYAIICERVQVAAHSDFIGHLDENEYYLKLKKECERLFGRSKDLRPLNMGWSKEGKLIKIDFGPISS